MSLIHHWEVNDPAELGNSIDEFLARLPGPTRLAIRGRDASRCRVLVTLLHGNEPSGIKAVHRLLRENQTPAVDVYCYLIAKQAASLPPLFSHRQVPGKRDYNRCFKEPFDIDDQGPVCEALLAEIQSLRPEAVVDMHNTTGEGPAFAVTKSYDILHDEIVSLFTDRLIVTDLQLGSIMETNTDSIPVVTIECGGAYSESADLIAYQGLQRYFGWPEIFAEHKQDWGLEILHNPMRLEAESGTRLSYTELARQGDDLSLKVDIEHLNFGLVQPGTFLGWAGTDCRHKLKLVDTKKNDHFDDFYLIKEGGLYTKAPLKMFMITSNADIALSDCLWYCVLAD